MTRTLVEPLLEVQGAAESAVEPPVENLIDRESPRLSRIHERTNAMVDRMLNSDPNRFQELSQKQQSGQ